MKPATVLVSLVAALAPLASACNEAPPLSDMPPGAIIFGNLEAPSSNAAALPAATPVAASANSARIFPREAAPFGKSHEQWVAEWYHWALGVPKSENPMLGGPCDVDQSGQVFFLAGTTGGADVRSCTIPAGKAIFLPIVNLVSFSCPEYADGSYPSYTCDVALSEDSLHSGVQACYDDGEIAVTLEIDGVAVGGLGEYRVHSETFLDDTSPANADDRVWPMCTGPIRENPCGVPVGSSRFAASEGFWSMLRPLPPGEHTIRFTANVAFTPDSTFALDVTYNLTVTP